MKPQKLVAVVSKLMFVAMLTVAMMGTSVVQAAALPNQISVQSQDVHNGILTIDAVTAAQAGWVVIYKNPNFTDAEIIGYAPVQKGVNNDVKVTLNTARLKLDDQIYTLWARLHVDNEVTGLFEWGLHGLPYNDGPVVQDGQQVIAAFSTEPAAPAASAAPATTTGGTKTVAATANEIKINGIQDLNTGVIEIGTVTALQDGWIVIYKNSNLTSGEIVGYAPVYKGVNTNVKVTISTRRLPEDQITLWAQLHADNGVPGLFEWGLRGLPYDDAPLTQNGQPVTLAFGITGL
ncbi:MAG: hypothetical protein U0559_04305 [Anaerolineae bacterium]